MRKTPALILGIVTVSLAVCGLTGARSSPQSSLKRRTPVLTNDDLGSTSREVVPLPADGEIQPLTSREPEAVRGAIAWHRDLRRAVGAARDGSRLIVADIYTDWCGWCKKMDKIIYSDPAIVALSRQQVFVKVNAEDRGEGQRFAEQIGVRGYPTTVVLDAEGTVLKLAQGYIPSPQAFLQFFEQARASQVR
jgi:thiol-disulfide isomerase/thioredoxin